MAIEIVDLSINSMVILHGYVSLPEGNINFRNWINVGCLIVIPPPHFFWGGGQPSFNNSWESIAGIMICI